MDKNEKIAKVSELYKEILETIGVDLTDDNFADTPNRVAKMYVNELFGSVTDTTPPKITVFDNTLGFDQILIERKISFTSTCAHHIMPIIGHVHIAYIPNEKVLGLSKFNRIVTYLSNKPQVQEALTQEIANFIIEVTQTQDVAVIVVAKHGCIQCRGVKSPMGDTVTSYLGGSFREKKCRQEFLSLIKLDEA
jgi:GTP cyclohydrolase IA